LKLKRTKKKRALLNGVIFVVRGTMSSAPLGFDAKVQEVRAVLGAEATEEEIMQLLSSSDYNVANAIARFYEQGELAGDSPASERSGELPTGPPVAAPASISMDRDGESCSTDTTDASAAKRARTCVQPAPAFFPCFSSPCSSGAVPPTKSVTASQQGKRAASVMHSAPSTEHRAEQRPEGMSAEMKAEAAAVADALSTVQLTHQMRDVLARLDALPKTVLRGLPKAIDDYNEEKQMHAREHANESGLRQIFSQIERATSNGELGKVDGWVWHPHDNVLVCEACFRFHYQ
jgi:hypothetical protein